MVIESNKNYGHDYDKWKNEVFDMYELKFGTDLATKFMNFVSSRYDKYKKNYLPHKVMWRCFDLHSKVINRNNQQVYGTIGRGGYGKTTLMKNVLFFHDPTFNQSRIATTMDKFNEVLYEVLNMKKSRYKAILIDEPSKETHSASKTWRMTEDLLGQIRQNNLIIGICATNLNNIKPSFYSLITGLFAFRKLYVYDYYDEDKKEGITGEIKYKYERTNTYACLYDSHIIRKAYIKNCYSYRDTPIDREQKIYDKQKKKAFMDKLKKLYFMRQKGDDKQERNKLIYKLYKGKKYKQAQLGKKFHLSTMAICKIIKKYDDF